MSHIPANNPTTNPALAGRVRRHFNGRTKALRHFAADATTEATLMTLREWLNSKIEAKDTVSISMLAKRALAVYLSHVAALEPQGIESEKAAVREGSHLFRGKPRKRNRYETRSNAHPRVHRQKNAS